MLYQRLGKLLLFNPMIQSWLKVLCPILTNSLGSGLLLTLPKLFFWSTFLQTLKYAGDAKFRLPAQKTGSEVLDIS